MPRSVSISGARRKFSPQNPAQTTLFELAADIPPTIYEGVRVGHFATMTARRGALPPDASGPTQGAPAQPTARPTPPSDSPARPVPIVTRDYRPAAGRIRAIGGAAYLKPDDLAEFAAAEAAIFLLMCDELEHSTDEITKATGGLGEALRRMRNLRGQRATSPDGITRYLHILCRRHGPKRDSRYRIEWHTQPQRNGAGGKG